MDFSAGVTDTVLGTAIGSNVITGVGGGGPTYTITAGAAQFASAVVFNTALIPGRDYFMFFDTNNTLHSYGVLASVVNQTQVTVTLSPVTLPAPVNGGSFIVLRDPSYTALTDYFIRLFRSPVFGFDPWLPGSSVVVS